MKAQIFLEKETRNMEQPQSEIQAAADPLFSDSTGNHGPLNDSCARGHVARFPEGFEQLEDSRRHRARPANARQEDTTIPLREATFLCEPPLVGSAHQGSTPMGYAGATDEQLVEAAKSLDKDAFAELSNRHVKSVQRRVYRIVRNYEDTEDVVQDALFKAFTHLSGFRGTSAFSTWLMSIAINSALMLLRKRRGQSEVSFGQTADGDQTRRAWEVADHGLDAETTYAKRQAIGVLSRSLMRLPIRYRSVLESYHVREHSMRETADTLGITLSATKSRLLRARLNLRASLARQGIFKADGYL